DVKTISNYIVSLTSDALSKLFNFGTGMYQLWYLSSPLVFNLLSYSVTIPGFMMLVAVGYSIGYSVIINQLDKDIKKINESIRQKADIYGGKLAQIEEHAEAIALKRGGKKEQQDLIKNLTERLTLQFEKLKTSV